MKSFVIFGMGRTGSSLLASLLDSHPQIRCEGEVFNLGRWRRPLRPLARIWRYCPMPYLIYRQAHTRLIEHKNVYGFKLHTKFVGDQLANIPGFLHSIDRKGWKVIHLQRSSLFDQLLSSLVALETKRYFGDNRESEPSVQVHIPEEKFSTLMERFFEITRRNQQILADIPHLKITYEADLAHDIRWLETVNRICEYLDISSTSSVTCRTKKPWSRPYSEIVVNYTELLSYYQAHVDDAF